MVGFILGLVIGVIGTLLVTYKPLKDKLAEAIKNKMNQASKPKHVVRKKRTVKPAPKPVVKSSTEDK